MGDGGEKNGYGFDGKNASSGFKRSVSKQSLDKNIKTENPEESDSLKFRKRKGTTDSGKLYEDYFPSYVILQLLQQNEVNDFRISTNDEKFGAFDDLVLEVEEINKSTEKYAIQLKHIDNRELAINSLTTGTRFNIMKYYESFQKNKKLLSEYELVLCTNANFKTDDDNTVRTIDLRNNDESVKVEITECDPFSLINTPNGKSFQFQLEPNNTEEIKKKYEDFFKRFFLYTNQRKAQELRKVNIPESLKELTSRPFVQDKFLKFISEWNLIVGLKNKLTKDMMIKMMTMHIIEDLIQPHIFCEVNEQKKLLQNAIDQFEITAFGSSSLENVVRIWGDAKSLLQDYDIKKINKILTQFQIGTKHITHIDHLTDEESTKLLWLMDKCPLILRDGPAAYEAAKLCGEKSKFVFITDNLDDEKLEQLTIFKTLSDLKRQTSTYNHILKNFIFTLFREEKRFEDLIREDDAFDNLITTDEIAKMSVNSDFINLKEEELCFPYIDRQLYINVIDSKYLQNIDENTMVLISNVGDEKKLRDGLQHCEIVSIMDELHKSTDDRTNRKKILSKKSMQHFSTARKSIDESNTRVRYDFQHFTTTGTLQSDAGIRKYQKNFKTSQDSSSKKLRLFYNKTYTTQEEFTSLCNKNKKYRKFHHFSYHEEHLQWIESIGDVSDLQKLSIKNENFVEDEKLCADNIRNNLNIVIGDPGMGKSIFVKKLKNDLLRKHLTIIIQPVDVPELCRRIKNSNNLQKFYTFIVESQFKDFGNLGRNVIQLLLKKGKTVFFWDALDELSEENRIIVEKLIARLSKNSVAQFLTSRAFLKKQLEDKFNVLSQELQPFNDQQQTKFIRKRLNEFCSEEELESIITSIKENIAKTSYREILGVPLQIYMLTELFRQDLPKYKKELTTLFITSELYFYFIEEKFNFYFKVKKKFPSNYKENLFMKQSLSWRKRNYQQVALKSIFGTIFSKESNTETEYFLSEIAENGDEFGIITALDVKKQTVFLHSSYAEYFAATYLAENWRNIPNLENIIFDRKYANVRYFFDTLSAKDSPVHIAVLCKNFTYIQDCKDRDELTRKDLLGRNALHLAASWGERYPLLETTKLGAIILIHDNINFETKKENLEYFEMIEKLLKNCDPEEKDQLFKMTSTKYAKKCECLVAVALIVKKQENQSSLKTGSKEFVYSLLYYGIKHSFHNFENLFANIEFARTESGNTLLHMAVETNQFQYLQKLLDQEVFKQNINYGNHFGETALLIAVKYNHVETMKYLIEKHADVNAANNNGWTPLHHAAWNGHLETVEHLIQKHANVNTVTNDGWTPLHLAAENGHLDTVTYLIQKHANVNQVSNNGWTPLHLAVKDGHLETVKYLIEKYANVNAITNDGWTLLDLAAWDGHLETLKYLIPEPANVNVVDKDNWTPLHCAAYNGHLETVTYLIQQHAKVNAVNNDGRTPLDLAAWNGHLETVEYLIQEHANVNGANSNGWTPIHLAAENGHLEIVKYLIHEHANVNAVTNDGWTLLDLAALNGHLDMVKYLIQEPENVNAVDNDGWTPLHCAAHNGHLDTVTYLIQKHANVNAANNEGKTPLHLAAENGHLETVTYLIHKHANVNAANNNGWTPLHLSVKNGHFETVKYLIQEHANVNAVTNDGWTLLDLAAWNGQLETVKYLIQDSANVNAVDNDGWTPLHVAAQNGHLETVKYFMQEQANVNAANNDGKTPLHLAAEEGQLETVKYLIENDANVNMADDKGITPLHSAVLNRHLEIVKYLIENNANVNTAVDKGITPLHLAALNGHFETVKYLIEKHATANEVTNDGWTPFHFAAQNGHLETVKYFIQEHANVNEVTNDGWSPLHLAAENGHIETLAYLIREQANVNAANNNGWTPLHLAVKYGHLATVKYLVQEHANVNAITNDGWTLLDLAAWDGHLEMLKYLIQKPENVNAVDNDCWTPLHCAAHNGHLDTVTYLIQKHANVNAVNNDGRTPLDLAVWNGHLETVKYLIQEHANVNTVSIGEWTPLHSAAQTGHLETVKYLIQGHANVNAVSNDGWTLLHISAEEGHLEIVKYLIQEHTNVNATNNDGWTPLHLSAENGHLETVEYLIQEHAEVNAVNNHGWTPLHCAVDKGHAETVICLIENGANINATVKDGNPLHIACKNGQKNIVEILLEAGADHEATTIDALTYMDVAIENHHEDIAELLRTHENNFTKST